MERVEVPTDTDLHARAVTLGEGLRARTQLLATAESCTGGWIAKLCTDLPGSSDWFVGGAVTYSNAAKQALLGVPAATLAQAGAVSRECALAMVAGALERFAATIAVAVTGIAGPGGGTPAKPVGTVWIAWQQRDGAARAQAFQVAGDRDAVRRQAVRQALDGIRNILTD